MKAVLALNEVEYEHTHSVSYLTALIEKEGIDLPSCREEIEGLTPWAVGWPGASLSVWSLMFATLC